MLLGGMRPISTLALTFALATLCSVASAQTWVAGRTTPSLPEVFAIDATGESGWLYGQEDVAGDGLDNFKQQEQSIDIRTAYAATDAQRFWVRIYVSDPNNAGGNVTAYVFIDSDQTTSTGGTAEAPEIDAKFSSDSSPGGYEYVVGISGSGAISDVWEWSATQGQYQTKQVTPAQANAETGNDLDPIRINGNDHGYLQASVDLGEVGLTQACLANLYVRTTNDTAALGAGDLEVGQVGSCVPADGNGDGVPDPVVPPTGCTDSSECPNGGICSGGKCVLTAACTDNAQCAADEQCDNGRCVAVPGGACTDATECNGLVCDNGQCVTCTGDAQCGSGICGPDGRCTNANTGSAGSGPTLQPGDEIQGGACTCRTAGHRDSNPLLLASPLALLALLLRRKRP